jgi:hypothetical protein
MNGCKAGYKDGHKYCVKHRCPCLEGSCENYGELTNADKIRSMNDEFLATQLVRVFKEGIKVLTDVDMPEELLDKFWNSFLERLKQPAEGE